MKPHKQSVDDGYMRTKYCEGKSILQNYLEYWKKDQTVQKHTKQKQTTKLICRAAGHFINRSVIKTKLIFITISSTFMKLLLVCR